MDLPTFLRTYKARSKNLHWFLGAGSSVNAGIMSAWEMTWEFKRDIYCSENGKSVESCKDLANSRIRSLIQNYLNSTGAHPEEDSLDEYSHYFSLAYRSVSDRRQYIDKKIRNAEIKFSHKVIASLLAAKLCKAIWTTNFDAVMEESWQSLGMPISRLNSASIENSLKASQCLREDRYPLYVKLHGDFQSTSLKNTTNELKEQDLDFKQALIDLVGTKYGFSIVGYSGRDDSIMEVFEKIIDRADEHYPGIFWFNRTGSKPISRVQSLIKNAQIKGVDAHVVDIPSFDELMLSIYKFLGNELSDFSSYLQPKLDRKSPVEVCYSEEQTDVIRMNAFKIISTPHTIYQLEAKIGGISDVKNALVGARNVIATRVKEGVLAFGDRDEIASIFKIEDKSTIVAQPFKVKDYKTSEIFLFYQMLGSIFCRNLPLCSYQGVGGLTLYIDPTAQDLTPFLQLNQALISKFDESPIICGNTPGLGCYWSESIKLRIEEKMGALWLFLTPSLFIEDSDSDWHNPNYVKQEDFRKRRLGSRYNKQFNSLLEGWCKCLGLSRSISNSNTVKLSAFSEDYGVNPLLEISTVSGFSRGGKNG